MNISTQGRFTSPDPFGGSMTLANPQSLNRYTYVTNNPMNAVDPSGMSGHAAMMSAPSNSRSSFNPTVTGIDIIAEDEAAYEDRLAETYAAVADAEFLNHAQATGAMTSEEAAMIAAGNPMLEAHAQQSQNPVTNNPNTIDNHKAKNQACQISVSFTGSYHGFDNGPSVETGLADTYGIGFSVNISGLSGDITVRSYTDDPKPSGWLVEQYVRDYNVLNGDIVRNDKEARMDPLERAQPAQFRNSLSWRDHPGTTVSGTKDYFTKRNFFIQAYNGDQHCEVEFHMTFRVSDGRMTNSGWGTGVYRW